MEIGNFDRNNLKEITHSFSKMACTVFVYDNMAAYQLLSDKTSFELLMAANRISKAYVEDTDFEIDLEAVMEMTDLKEWMPDPKSLSPVMEKQVEKI